MKPHALDIEHIAESQDPYPLHAELREQGLRCLDDGRWVVATAAAVELVLGAQGAAIGPMPSDPAGAIQARMARFSDGQDHGRRRAIATNTIGQLDVDRLRRRAGELTAALLAGRAGCDLMALVARHVPLAVLAEALGLASDPAVIAAADLVRAIAPIRGAQRGDAETPMRELCAMFRGATNEHDEETLNRASLLFQTSDATAGLIGNSILATERFGVPQADPAHFVGEVSRFDPSVQFTVRTMLESLDVDGQRLPVGCAVIVDLAAADRDPRRWDAPDDFDPSRIVHADPQRGLGAYEFGWGPHRCPGQAVALSIATGVVEAVLATGGHCAGKSVAYEPRFNLRIPRQVAWSS